MTRAAALLLISAALSGCTVTRYAKVRVVSDPDLAYVSVLETGSYVESTPGTGIVRRTFYLWQPRRGTYHFRFRKRDQCDDVVAVNISGIWRRSRAKADAGLEFVAVHGLLGSPPCAAPVKK
jgi:hypothetical protein